MGQKLRRMLPNIQKLSISTKVNDSFAFCSLLHVLFQPLLVLRRHVLALSHPLCQHVRARELWQLMEERLELAVQGLELLVLFLHVPLAPPRHDVELVVKPSW